MRQFYQQFQNIHALRGELSWTHYRLLLKVEKDPAREFYMEEAIASNWNTRTLERQINNFYYERMLLSSKEHRHDVKQESENKKEVFEARDMLPDKAILSLIKSHVLKMLPDAQVTIIW